MSELVELAKWIKEAVESGVLALVLVIAGLVYQTRGLKDCTRRDEVCADNLLRTRVAVARLYSILKARLNQDDPLPSLEELMNDRRTQPRTPAERDPP